MLLPKTAAARITLTFIVVAVVLSAAISVQNWRLADQVFQQQFADRLQITVRNLSSGLVPLVTNREGVSLAHFAEDVVASDPVIKGIAIYTEDGALLANSGTFAAPETDLSSNSQEAAGSSGSGTSAYFSEIVTPDGLVVGRLGVVVDRSVLAAQLNGQISKQVGILGLILVMCLLAGWVFLRQSVFGPASRLRQVVRELSAGGPASIDEGSSWSIAEDLERIRTSLEDGERLKKFHAFQSQAFEEAPFAMMMLGPMGVVVAVNAKMRALYQDMQSCFADHWPEFDPAALLGKTLPNLENQMPEVHSVITSPDAPHGAQQAVFGELQLQVTCSSFWSEAGENLGAMIQFEDISEEKQERGALDALGLTQAIIAYRADGTCTFANRFSRNLLGREKAELVGSEWTELFGEDIGYAKAWAAALAGEKADFRTTRAIDVANDKVVLDGALHGIVDCEGRVTHIVETSRDVTKAVRAEVAAEEERRARRMSVDLVTSHLRVALSALASGDLTHRVSAEFPEEYQCIRKDFNTSVSQLESTIANLKASSHSIGAGALESNQASEILAQRTEAQAATLATSVEALHEITSSIGSTADRAAAVDQAVKKAQKVAREGGDIVVETVRAMKGIAQSSEEISKIIRVIDDISFQTNLLALNAGVEAARAGDAGRGFAVVASEVRALAQRCSDAARQIKTLVVASGDQVEQGVVLVDRAGASLTLIVNGVSEISSQIAMIAQSSKEQATGLLEINDSINQLDKVTQENAAMVEQATASGIMLRGEADNLTALISNFRLNDDDLACEASEQDALSASRAKPVAQIGYEIAAKKDLLVKHDNRTGWEDF